MNSFNLTYAQLIAAYPPRPITNDEQYWATQDRIDELLEKGLLTPDEKDYLAVLGMMVERYEDLHEPEITLRGVDLIRALMEEQELKQRDLVKPIFGTDSIASAVLNEKRRLTVAHIDKLAAYFNLPHALFFESLADESTMIPSEGPKGIGKRPSKPRHNIFVEFVSEIDLEGLRQQTNLQGTIQTFESNNRRIRRIANA
jgi:HTH-type transcriptional regulator/antitoxin HigA